jgi:hypothetical protein
MLSSSSFSDVKKLSNSELVEQRISILYVKIALFDFCLCTCGDALKVCVHNHMTAKVF